MLSPVAEAQTETVLFTFTGGATGSSPLAGLVGDEDGHLYGTTSAGGGGGIFCDHYIAPGCGTVFKLSPAGRETVLHSFTGGPDGSLTYVTFGGLVRDPRGNLYGVAGSTYSNNGTVFKIDPFGHETVLYAFPRNNLAAGGFPYSGLILDAEGNLYGTTAYGGASGFGGVFKVDPTGNETLLYAFHGPDGQAPNGPLVRDAAGNLYGTTVYGGPYPALGNVFKITPSGQETVLYVFPPQMTNGAYPNGGLIRDLAGNLYGTTMSGGAYNWGTIFKLDPAGNQTVLYSFRGGNLGEAPAGLVRDFAGNLYGVAAIGIYGWGLVFKLDPAGKLTVLYSFTGGADGGYPNSGLALDRDGNLYGTTNTGGHACTGNYSGCGVIFKIAPK
jgi:uncharacterized repeat protein (TIGR03803 family)